MASVTGIINEQYMPFCKYVIESRAIPRLSDGLKPVQRRVLWIGTKVAKDFTKVAKLAGNCLSIHPHGNTSIEDSIGNMAQLFAGANNINYFEGDGTFGERINGPGKGISSARYVGVKLSENFKNIFGVDTDLINMISNYDETDIEPESFLPVIPTVLLNPVQGIAVGFACNILPRNISDVKKLQIAYLKGKTIDKKRMRPYYEGFKGSISTTDEKDKWICEGVFERTNSKNIRITELPIGMNRENFINILDKLEESEHIKSYEDNCRSDFDFNIKLNGVMDDEEITKKFKLSINLNENITIIGFNGTSVLERITDIDVIKRFTDWRFNFYLTRFQKMLEFTNDDLSFKKSLMLVIVKGLFKKFPSQKRQEIVDDLKMHKIKDKHITRILQIPIYKFGKEEVDKLKSEIIELEKNKTEYMSLVKNEDLRIEYFIKEIKNV